jgi:hypothetical protein
MKCRNEDLIQIAPTPMRCWHRQVSIHLAPAVHPPVGRMVEAYSHSHPRGYCQLFRSLRSGPRALQPYDVPRELSEAYQRVGAIMNNEMNLLDTSTRDDF